MAKKNIFFIVFIIGIVIPLSLFAAQSDSVTLRVTVLDSPPQGTISINNNSDYTNSTAVNLSLSASDAESSVTQMRFSNDNTAWSDPIGYAATATWTLTSGDGTKAVWAKFKDTAGNWSTAEIKDAIVLDTTAPTITQMSPQDGISFRENDKVSLSATVNDSDASPLEYQFSVDGVIKQAWSAQSSYTWTACTGNHRVKIEVRDIGGQDSKEAEICVLREPLKMPE